MRSAQAGSQLAGRNLDGLALGWLYGLALGWLDAVFSTVPSVRNNKGRDGTAKRRPSKGRTETVPSF
jgi:hypothetical protein